MKSVAFSFLFLYVALVELYLGCLAMACFRSLVRTKWLEPLMPPVFRALRYGWALALLFPLLVLAGPLLFPWAGADPHFANAFQALYLSPAAFAGRGAAYWALWLLLARGARAAKPWSGGPGLALLVLSATFAGTDWVLSLEKDFGSTAFGFVFFLGATLLAYAFALFHGVARGATATRQDQGSVHFALVCVFTYVSFMQFLVVWSGNLPDEAHWYLARSRGGWGVIPAAGAVLQFFVPFFLLMQSNVKRSIPASRALALLSVAMQVLLAYWSVAPALRASFLPGITDLLALALFAFTFALLGREARAG